MVKGRIPYIVHLTLWSVQSTFTVRSREYVAFEARIALYIVLYTYTLSSDFPLRAKGRCSCISRPYRHYVQPCAASSSVPDQRS